MKNKLAIDRKVRKDNTYSSYTQGSEKLVSRLVEDHLGWAKSIAKTVARAWNLDWQTDGLDGGAYEGLLFCARRYDPQMGVPFRAYARRRIHEAATKEAKNSKSWAKSVDGDMPAEQEAREVSATLLNLFPELREGLLPAKSIKGVDEARVSIRQLLASACLVTAFRESRSGDPERRLEYRKVVEVMSLLEPVHQHIMWAIYWEGQSMRALARTWEIDDLSVIREHREILNYLHTALSHPERIAKKHLKVRRGLRTVAQRLKHSVSDGPFSRLGESVAVAIISIFLLSGISSLTKNHECIRCNQKLSSKEGHAASAHNDSFFVQHDFVPSPRRIS